MLTDSGGCRRRRAACGVPCVTLRDNTERPESVEVGANVWPAPIRSVIAAAAERCSAPRGWRNPFGDGRAGERIVRSLHMAA